MKQERESLTLICHVVGEMTDYCSSLKKRIQTVEMITSNLHRISLFLPVLAGLYTVWLMSVFIKEVEVMGIHFD